MRKSVYVVFSKTNTKIGAMIRGVTHNQYNHVSFSEDENLVDLYTFARYHKNSPFEGGFVKEYPMRMMDGYDIMVKVCRVELDESEYELVRRRFMYFSQNQEQTLYNLFCAAMTPLGKKVSIPGAYTCVNFVATVLGYPDVISIPELEGILDKDIYYEGSYEQYLRRRMGRVPTHWDGYMDRQNPVQILKGTCVHFGKLCSRLRT